MDRGKFGENVARRFLLRHGYKILAQNWRYGHSEIDLIGQKDDCLVFVEVKIRTSRSLTGGYWAANSPSKKRAVKRACLAYLSQQEGLMSSYRYDIIEIITPPGNNNSQEIYHFENVELFDKCD